MVKQKLKKTLFSSTVIWSLIRTLKTISFGKFKIKRDLKDSLFVLLCHVRVSEWVYTVYLPKCQGTPCSKQVWYLTFKWQQGFEPTTN